MMFRVKEDVGISVRDVDGRHPVVSPEEETLQRVKTFHLEFFVPKFRVDRPRVEATPPFPGCLLGHGKKALIKTLASFVHGDYLQDLLLEIRPHGVVARLQAHGIAAQPSGRVDRLRS